MSNLKRVINAGVDEAENAASELASATRSRARRASKNLQNVAAEGQDLATDLFADAMATLRSAGNLVRERPISTATAMVVGGLLIGGLYTFLRRR